MRPLNFKSEENRDNRSCIVWPLVSGAWARACVCLRYYESHIEIRNYMENTYVPQAKSCCQVRHAHEGFLLCCNLPMVWATRILKVKEKCLEIQFFVCRHIAVWRGPTHSLKHRGRGSLSTPQRLLQKAATQSMNLNKQSKPCAIAYWQTE